MTHYDLTRYVVERPPSRDPIWGPGEYDGAREFASRENAIVVAYHYELSDSELIDDFRDEEE